MVTAAGFKPATPTSVVWYSIQLSYAANYFSLASAKIGLFFFSAKQIFKKVTKLTVFALYTAYSLLFAAVFKPTQSPAVSCPD